MRGEQRDPGWVHSATYGRLCDMVSPVRERVHRSEDEIARVLAVWRQVGRKPYTAARITGVPRSNIVQWIARYGPDFGLAPADAIDTGTGQDDGLATVEGEPQETRASVLGFLVKLNDIRHRYADHLLKSETVAESTPAAASVIVKDATAQIQLLTGQPTGRSETRVRYVDRGALRELARRTKQNRVIEVTKSADS
jgi:hypothetical protein